VFDVVVVIVICVLTLFGLWNGMIRQLFSLAGVIAGYLIAMRFFQPASKYLTSFHSGMAKAISFVAIFVTCIIIAHLLGWMIGKIFKLPGLELLNRIGGAVLGFAKGSLIVVLVVMVLLVFLPPDSSLFKNSSTMKYILPVAGALKSVTPKNIKAKYNEKTVKERRDLRHRGHNRHEEDTL
jgi:membrane protein required for colicin V production